MSSTNPKVQHSGKTTYVTYNHTINKSYTPCVIHPAKTTQNNGYTTTVYKNAYNTTVVYKKK